MKKHVFYAVGDVGLYDGETLLYFLGLSSSLLVYAVGDVGLYAVGDVGLYDGETLLYFGVCAQPSAGGLDTAEPGVFGVLSPSSSSEASEASHSLILLLDMLSFWFKHRNYIYSHRAADSPFFLIKRKLVFGLSIEFALFKELNR